MHKRWQRPNQAAFTCTLLNITEGLTLASFLPMLKAPPLSRLELDPFSPPSPSPSPHSHQQHRTGRSVATARSKGKWEGPMMRTDTASFPARRIRRRLGTRLQDTTPSFGVYPDLASAEHKIEHKITVLA